MPVLTLPRYVAGADLAAQMVAGLDPSAVAGGDVELDARLLVSASSSFARGCVDLLLVHGRARRLCVVGGPEHFRAYLRDAAQAAGLGADRLIFRPANSLSPSSAR